MKPSAITGFVLALAALFTCNATHASQASEDDQHTLNEQLLEAIHHSCLPAVITALDQGADINTTDKQQEDQSALIRSIIQGDIPITKELLGRNADVNQADKDKYTAIMHATKKQNMPAIECLLKKRDLNILSKNRYDETAVDIARNEAKRYFYHQCKAKSSFNIFYNNSYQKEVANANKIRELISVHQLIYTKTHKITQATGGCLYTDVANIISEYILQNIPTEEEQDLIWAASDNRIKYINDNNHHLVSTDFDIAMSTGNINVCNENGNTPLMQAVHFQHPISVEILLKKVLTYTSKTMTTKLRWNLHIFQKKDQCEHPLKGYLNKR